MLSCSCANNAGLWLRSAGCSTMRRFWHDDEQIVAYLAQGFRAFSGTGTAHYTFHRSASLVVKSTLYVHALFLGRSVLVTVPSTPQHAERSLSFRFSTELLYTCAFPHLVRAHPYRVSSALCEHLNTVKPTHNGTSSYRNFSKLVCNCRRQCCLLILLVCLDGI